MHSSRSFTCILWCCLGYPEIVSIMHSQSPLLLSLPNLHQKIVKTTVRRKDATRKRELVNIFFGISDKSTKHVDTLLLRKVQETTRGKSNEPVATEKERRREKIFLVSLASSKRQVNLFAGKKNLFFLSSF